jgi:uncharacterized protein YecE (DUF72 family)
MPPAQDNKNEALAREERRQRRLLRREKQRADNIGRAAKMHAARLEMERAGQGQSVPALKASAYVGWAWVYFNNDYDAHAPRNAATMQRLLGRLPFGRVPAR